LLNKTQIVASFLAYFDAMRLRCSEIQLVAFHYTFAAESGNEIILKMVNIWRSYGQE